MPPLRGFRVYYREKDEVVMAHTAQVDNGILMLLEGTLQGTKMRRAFRTWDDMEEVVVAPPSRLIS